MPLEATAPPTPATPIECDYLDSENVHWTREYIRKCESKLEGVACERHAGYLKREIDQYRELLSRFQQA